MSQTPESSGCSAFTEEQKCVLVVEDEILIRWMLSEELRDVGYHVIEAGDTTEAFSILKTLTPDLIVSDVRMPGPLDGMALLARVREVTPLLPVIITSGHLHPSQALTDGATQFVAKPYRIESVVEAVQEVLDDRQ